MTLPTHIFVEARVKFVQMRMLPSGLDTTTMPEHQSVGSSMRLIMPSDSMRCRAASVSERGTRREVAREKGIASSRNKML